MAKDVGCVDAFDFPGFVPICICLLFCRGIGPFCWVALSGDPEDIARTDAKVKELIPDDPHLHRWLGVADGSAAANARLARVLWNDPGTGVMRHADAGYDAAKACAKGKGLDLPMLDG